MGIFFVYILKSSVCLAVFYLFYRLLLSRETFHRFNRVALLSIYGAQNETYIEGWEKKASNLLIYKRLCKI